MTTNNKFVDVNGITMLELSAINNTGVAQAYCTTRHGGISSGTYSSMNCNIYKQLDIENGKANFKLACGALGIDDKMVITNRFTHFTDKVRCVTKEDIIDLYAEPLAPHADGLVTDDPEVTLFFYAADCAIISFVDVEKRVVGGLHAGWKGSLIPIIENTVSAMCDGYGCRRENIIAQIAPSIGACCFECGYEVASQFEDAGHGEYISWKHEKPHIDLNGVNIKLLRKAGIISDNIHSVDICTCCHPDLFHSYRRGPIAENGDHLNGINGIFIRLIK